MDELVNLYRDLENAAKAERELPARRRSLTKHLVPDRSSLTSLTGNKAFEDMCAVFLECDSKKTPALVKLLKKKRKSKAEQDEIKAAFRAAHMAMWRC